MTNQNDISTQQPTTCPTRQMSFADVARYLQDGFDEPVQRALSAHIQYCNACQDELDRVEAIMSTGRHLMGSQIVDSEDHAREDEVLSEALVAAYIDGGLSEKEKNLVTQHLADSYNSFATFSAIEKELKAIPNYSTPDRAKATVRVEEPVLLPSFSERLREETSGLVAAIQQLFELKWPAPALAFAAGVIAMLVIIPASKTVIPVPGMMQTGTDETARVLSGNVDAPAAAVPGASIVTLPESISGNITFTWAAIDGATYRAELLDADNNNILEPVNTTEAEWNVDSSLLEEGQTYTLFVTASTEEAGVRPVATMSVVR